MRTFNVEGLLRTIILFVSSMFLYSLVKTEEITYYINPKFIPFTYFAIITLFLMAIFQLSYSFENKHKLSIKNIRGLFKPAYIIFLSPIFLGIMFPTEPLDTTLAEKRGINLNSNQNQVESEPIFEPLIQNNIINVTEKNFLMASSDVGMQPDNYLNKRIQLSGFVYSDDSLKENEFVCARYMVSCCTADASVVGFLCKLPQGTRYSDGTWVKVDGVVQKTSYENQDLAIIIVKEIIQIDPPKDPYVY